MFPKSISNGRNSLGQLGGTISLIENSTGLTRLVDSTSITSPDVDDTTELELNEGSGYNVRDTGYIAAVSYTTGLLIRKRVYNSYFGTYGSYVSGTATARDTNGITAESSRLAALGSITIDNLGSGFTGTVAIDLTFLAGMVGEAFYLSASGTFNDVGAPFLSYPVSNTLLSTVSGTSQTVNLNLNPSGGSGAYFGSYTVQVYLTYVYPDGPMAIGNSTIDSTSF